MATLIFTSGVHAYIQVNILALSPLRVVLLGDRLKSEIKSTRVVPFQKIKFRFIFQADKSPCVEQSSR